MTKQLSVGLLLIVVGAGLAFSDLRGRASAATGGAQAASQQTTAAQVIARERASYEAWQRKDKAFFADLLADEATYFSAFSPYLETEPKVNFLPKFEQHAEMFKFNDFQMYNPRVQVYGDVAVLTYNSSVSASYAGRPMNYTGKMTVVYARRDGAWRVVHGHESINPGAQQ